MSNEELFNELMKKLSNMDYIHTDDIPNIDLYMDQLTTFMDRELGQMKRYDEDKILTKTMINNYTKNKLLPPPVKKKYSRDHVLILTFIYYFKSFISITDIQAVLRPLIQKFVLSSDSSQSLERIYSEIFSSEKKEMANFEQNISKKFAQAQTAFTDAPDNERELLQRFTFICLLGFDIYLKKQLIESILDLEKKEEE